MIALCTLFLFVLLPSSIWSQDARALIPDATNVIGVVEEDAGSLLLFTRDFKVYRSAQGSNWTLVELKLTNTTTNIEVRQVNKIYKSHSGTLFAVGQVLHDLQDGRFASAILRSVNGGTVWTSIPLGVDTLANTKSIRGFQNGFMYLLDRVGRYWWSENEGLAWKHKFFPKDIQPGAVLEMDMMNPQIGMCIDRTRAVHFTTNAWQSLIVPSYAPDPNNPVQPLLNDQFSWARIAFLFDNHIVMPDGRDVFITPIDRISWRRWDSVISVSISNDGSHIVFADVNHNVWKQTSMKSAPNMVGSTPYIPNWVESLPNSVVAYRADTGPMISVSGFAIDRRPLTNTKQIPTPKSIVKFKKMEYGIQRVNSTATLVDVYKRTLGGEWQRDTVLPIASDFIDKDGSDLLILGDLGNRTVYNLTTRSTSRLNIVRPLEKFLKSPIHRFRVFVARDGDDSTHVQWCEYRLHGATYKCAEIVDSSKIGITSVPFINEVSASEVKGLLQAANDDGNQLPSVKNISASDADYQDYVNMLDTLFLYDAYLDTLDLYRTPPYANEHARNIKKQFLAVRDRLQNISDIELQHALHAWRRWPTDDVSKYSMEFQNQSGHVISIKLERDDEAHPPLLMPWVVQGGERKWFWYSRMPEQFYRTSLAPTALPAMFKEMSRTVWCFAAVASYYDAVERGRWHRWLSRKVIPNYAE